MSAYNPIATMQKLEAGGVSHKQAEAILDGLSDARADLVTKADLEAGLLGVRSELMGIRSELSIIRADFNAALNAMALRLFLATAAVTALSMSMVGVLIEIHK